MNLKNDIRVRSNEGEVWNCRSDSDRPKAFRRKARFESIGCLRISSAKSGSD